MLKYFYRRAGALLLCFSLLILPGCSPDSGETEEAAEDVFKEEAVVSVTSASDGLFSISYVAEEGLNPYSVSGSTNQSVCGLIYDSLFLLNEEFIADTALCEAYTANEDSTEYKLKIRSGIKFSDGDELSIEDIIYSLSCARNSSLYGERLSIIKDVSPAVDEEGEELADTITVALEKAHGDLPVLMNIPVIRYGSLNETHPLGTGPYKYSDSGASPKLTANASYWGGNAPIDEIYLMETEDAASAFERDALDVVNLDPTNNSLALTGALDVRINNTTVMEFIGFNLNKITDANMRKAISGAINSEEIIKTCLRSSCTASSLPIHPSSAYYSDELAREYGYNMDMAAELIDKAKPEASSEPSDTNMTVDDNAKRAAETAETNETAADADAEKATDTEEETWLSIRLLVCSDSTARFESAKMIADSLKKLGIEVTVVGKKYSEYIKALENGNFDLYYGQVKLKSDFDLSALLTSSGSINYGHVTDSEYSAQIRQFLSAGGSAKAAAAEKMCRYILENAPISVIGFKQMEVITKQGVVMDMNPHQDNIFADVTVWKINV